MNNSLKYLLLVLLIFISKITVSQIACIDSLNTFLVKNSDVNTPGFRTRAVLIDESICFGSDYLTSKQTAKTAVFSIDAQQNIKFAKEILHPENKRMFVNQILPLKNGNIAWTLGVFENINNNVNEIIVLVTDNMFNEIWQKRITLPSFISPNIHSISQSEGLSGELLTAFHLINSIDYAFHVVSISNSGHLLWSNSFDKNFEISENFLEGDYNFSAIGLLNNQVLCIGRCLSKTLTYYNKLQNGIVGLLLDKVTGKPIWLRRILEKSALYNGLKVTIGPHYEKNNAFKSWNNSTTSTFLTKFHEINGLTSYRHLVKYNFDTAFRPVNSFLIRRDYNFRPNPSSGIGPNSTNFTECALGDDGTIGILNITKSPGGYALYDSSGKLLKSKIFKPANQLPNEIVNEIIVNDSKKSIHVFNIEVSNPYQTKVIKDPFFQQSLLNADCTKDSIFTSIQPLELMQDEYKISESPIDLLMVSASNLITNNITNFSTLQTSCIVKSSCISISATGSQKSCVNNLVEFVARKNEDCLQKINWQVDSSLLSIESFTDSSIFVRLKMKGLTNVITYTDCGIADTIHLEINASEKNIDFKSDTLSLCKEGDEIVLSIPGDFKDILWNTGSKQPENLFTEPGKYWVTAMDDCGIKFSDTIQIVKTSFQPTIPTDVRLCLGDSFNISKVNFLKTYDWEPKIGVSEYADYFSLAPTSSINYLLRLEDIYGCKSETKLKVNIEKCIEQVWFPNSFTPNGDGLNDQFGGTGSFEPEKFELSVFDRWGQKVFQSNSIYNKWNGNVKGKPLATGAYVWVCRYKFMGKEWNTANGTLMLLR